VERGRAAAEGDGGVVGEAQLTQVRTCHTLEDLQRLRTVHLEEVLIQDPLPPDIEIARTQAEVEHRSKPVGAEVVVAELDGKTVRQQLPTVVAEQHVPGGAGGERGEIAIHCDGIEERDRVQAGDVVDRAGVQEHAQPCGGACGEKLVARRRVLRRHVQGAERSCREGTAVQRASRREQHAGDGLAGTPGGCGSVRHRISFSSSRSGGRHPCSAV